MIYFDIVQDSKWISSYELSKVVPWCARFSLPSITSLIILKAFADKQVQKDFCHNHQLVLIVLSLFLFLFFFVILFAFLFSIFRKKIGRCERKLKRAICLTKCPAGKNTTNYGKCFVWRHFWDEKSFLFWVEETNRNISPIETGKNMSKEVKRKNLKALLPYSAVSPLLNTSRIFNVSVIFTDDLLL